jgi:hypothetical protein
MKFPQYLTISTSQYDSIQGIYFELIQAGPNHSHAQVTFFAL